MGHAILGRAMLAATALVTLTAAQAADAAVTFLFADVVTGVDADASVPRNGGTQSKVASDSAIDEAFTFPSGPLTASSTATPFVTGADAAAGADASLLLSSAEAGTFDFTSGANAFVSVAGGVANANATSLAGDYSFSIDRSSSFQLTYDSGTFSGPTASLAYFLTGGTTNFNAVVSAPGVITYQLDAGEYLFSLTHSGSVASQTGIGSATANSFSSASFLITAVPEPASWALLIGGFGLVGGVLRRRRADRTIVRFA